MRGEYALKWLVCTGVAWSTTAASIEDNESAGVGGTPLRESPLVPKEDWLSEYTKLRKPMLESKTNLDCLFEERKFMRPYPHDCYGHDFHFDTNAFWRFWKHVRGDLQYTFDFVLYEEFFEHGGGRDKAVTSFWLLIAYLKHLAIKIPDPNDIAAGNLLAEKQKIYEKFKEELMALNRRAQAMTAEVDDLMRKLKQGCFL